MTKHLRLTPVLLMAALLAGCQGPCQKLGSISAPLLGSGGADFTNYVAVGTSISAGYQSGGVVDRHQVNSFTAIFARQVGKTVQLDGKGTFSEPTVNGNGAPALLQLLSLSPLNITAPATAGTPTNSAYPTPYSNLGVPGALAYDFLYTTNYGGDAFQLVARPPLFPQTIAAQLLSKNPTFISFEYGANEVLGPATSGSAVAPHGIPPAQFEAAAAPAAYAGIVGFALLNTIHAAAPAAKVALFNVPDVRSIPFFTTFPSMTVDTRTGGYRGLLGWVHRDSSGVPVWRIDSLSATELVTLKAQVALANGIGFRPNTYNYLAPTVAPTGLPLDSALVLDDMEQAVVAGNVTAMNASLASLAAANAAWIAPVDLHALLATLAAHGTTLGGTHYSTAYVTGGLFSLDGVHPTDIGHSIIANAMIDAVNHQFGSAVPNVDSRNYATASSFAAKPVAGPGTSHLRGLHIEGLDEKLQALFRR